MSVLHQIVGQFFLTFDADGRLECRGEIIGYLEAEYYQVQFFCAGMGEPTNCAIFHLSDMTRWKFYLSEDRWHDAFLNFARVWK